MRLINTTTERLVQLASPPDRYAILSHTWGEGEVSFQDVENGCTSERDGYAKFQGAVKLARDDGYQYIWIDNCCIDKSSSAELSEAINSMFTWYRRSSKCYVYLHDVSAPAQHSSSAVERAMSNHSLIYEEHFRRQLNHSRWFLRSWTLQELIAPSAVHFYAREWTSIGRKHDPVWTRALNELTGISYEVLQYPEGYKNASVAQRMSWASNRDATREEDISYSLFGIFDINMAPLYGEGGPSAFRRLQEEIIRRHADDSILAWKPAPHDAKSWSQSTYRLHRGLSALAHSPACFRDARDVVHFLSSWGFELDNMTMTPLGLLLEAPVIHQVHGLSAATAVLSSRISGDFRRLLGIELRHAQTRDGHVIHSSQSSQAVPVYQRTALRYVVVGRDITIETLQNTPMEKFRLLEDVQLSSGQGRGLSTRQKLARIWLRSYPSEFVVAGAYPQEAWRPGRQVFEPHFNDQNKGQRRTLVFKDSRVEPHTLASHRLLVVDLNLQLRSLVDLPQYHVRIIIFSVVVPAGSINTTIEDVRQLYTMGGRDVQGDFILDRNGTWRSNVAKPVVQLSSSKARIKFCPEQVLGEWVNVLDITGVE